MNPGDMASDPTNPQAPAPAVPPEEEPAAPQENSDAQATDQFYNPPASQNTEVEEFVKSLYDSKTGKFPRGETGVITSVEKKYGHQAGRHAQECIENLKNTFDENIMRMRKLAGVS